MNDQTPFFYDTGTPVTPTGLQNLRLLQSRRAIMALLVTATISLFTWGFAVMLGSDGWNWLDIGILVAFLIGTPWTVIGFWNAIIGYWLLHGVKNPLARVCPFIPCPKAREPLNLRTAILMTLRNEDPARAFTRLRIIRNSLEATGQGAHFDYYVLSDTSIPAIAAEEEAHFSRWQLDFPDARRTHYRRRTQNDGFKAGNLRNFAENWGVAYTLMLPLDADSLMSGAEIVKLATIMQAHPRIGILQSLVTGTPSQSAFARIFQFGMRHGMRSYTIGHAWWNGDCGPYWGHNALIRVAPFVDHCALPKLPGRPPLGGWILSHDLIEATLMRRAGFEVRVVPVEGESWEDNPPTLLDFTKRDLRWCQGNMQYWRLLAFPGILPLSRLHIMLGILMYLGSVAWMVMVALFALKVFDPPQNAPALSLSLTLFAASLLMAIAPKLAGMLDVATTRGELARYGGGWCFTAGVFTEILFSTLLAPIVAIQVSIFMVSLLFGRNVIWSGQQRDIHSLSWLTAAQGLWPQTLIGGALFALLMWKAPGALPWASPLLVALICAIPFAVLTASPRFGLFLTRMKLCAIPEESALPSELATLHQPEIPPLFSAAKHQLQPVELP